MQKWKMAKRSSLKWNVPCRAHTYSCPVTTTALWASHTHHGSYSETDATGPVCPLVVSMTVGCGVFHIPMLSPHILKPSTHFKISPGKGGELFSGQTDLPGHELAWASKGTRYPGHLSP